MKIIFIINRYKYRKLAFNNFLKSKILNGYRLIVLSGPLLSWLGYLIYKLNLSNKFKFISCDGWPFLSNEKNSINIWFGGTILKIPENYKNYKNNYVTASTLFTKTSNIIQFYPFNIKKRNDLQNPKIVIALSCKIVNDPLVLKIWIKNKERILKDLSLLDNQKFWESIEINDLNFEKKQFIYSCIKSLVRIELLKIIKENFNDQCMFIGDDLKKYFADAYRSDFHYGYLKKLYDGNICLDFLAKDGDQILYPRSVEILENGGTLFQIETNNSEKLFEHHKDNLTFNSPADMIKKLESLISKKELNVFNNFFIKKFNMSNYNQDTLKNILI
tara:strand:- start:302 stop:1294 length:993 start_codon:yes stop_codon:yes gene_type:complete